MFERKRIWTVVLVAAGLAAFGWQANLYSGPMLNDDAFISFRYAANLADGQGLVFNPGERVEGFTNLLWVLVLAAVRRLGGDIPTAAHLLGLVLGGATIVLTAAWPPPSAPMRSPPERGAEWRPCCSACPTPLPTTPPSASRRP